MSTLHLLHSIPISQLIPPEKKIVRVSSTTPVQEGLEILLKHNILSVPVFNESQKIYIGMVDMFDLVDYTVFGPYRLKNFDFKFFSNFTFPNRTMGDVVEASERAKDVYITHLNEPLDTVITSFTKGAYHRALIIKDPEDVESDLSLISQSDIIRSLLVHKDNSQLKEVFQRSAAYLKPMKTKIISCNQDTKAMDAFRLLSQKGVQAVAITNTNNNNQLVATLSVSDLRGLRREKFGLLEKNVLEYLKELEGSVTAPVCCKENDNLLTIMELAAQNKIHRVWIVNENQQPVDVISLSDMLLPFIQ